MSRKASQAVKRDASRQHSRWTPMALRYGLATAVLAVAVIGGLRLHQWLTDPTAWPVAHVRLQGEFRHLEREAIREALGALRQQGFFAVDVERIRERLDALAWVDSVSVRRLWPDGLHLRIEEQVPVARWGDTGLLNAQGEVFIPADVADFSGLPQLHGPESLRDSVIRHYIAFRGILDPIGRHLVGLELDARRSWRVRLDNGMDLRLGRDAVSERLRRFVGIYPRVFAADERAAERVDLRYSNGFAVRWTETDNSRRQES